MVSQITTSDIQLVQDLRKLVLHVGVPNRLCDRLALLIVYRCTLLHVEVLTLHAQVVQHDHLHIPPIVPPLLSCFLLLGAGPLLKSEAVLLLQAGHVLHPFGYLLDGLLVPVHLAKDGSLVEVSGDHVVLRLAGLAPDQYLLDLQGETHRPQS